LSDRIPYIELDFRKSFCCKSLPNIRYLLKLFSVKKLESISIISELKTKVFSALTSFKSTGTNACELVSIGETRSIKKKVATLGIE
jgi:hypothetical protein